ncbi:hypothetical protein F5051DRAFT_394138 [Lentinula edodes]|nr:hypothetical protein F5051DRAFT_394138 [Lentinula edodes]
MTVNNLAKWMRSFLVLLSLQLADDWKRALQSKLPGDSRHLCMYLQYLRFCNSSRQRDDIRYRPTSYPVHQHVWAAQLVVKSAIVAQDFRNWNCGSLPDEVSLSCPGSACLNGFRSRAAHSTPSSKRKKNTTFRFPMEMLFVSTRWQGIRRMELAMCSNPGNDSGFSTYTNSWHLTMREVQHQDITLTKLPTFSDALDAMYAGE